jgi:hypothetical protein
MEPGAAQNGDHRAAAALEVVGQGGDSTGISVTLRD